MKVAFKDLNEARKKRLFELRSQGSALKGLNGEKEAQSFLSRKQPKTTIQWDNMRFYFMLRIDKARKNLGLPPIHFK